MIDSSTSLIQKQSRDIVRLAMGSPASSSIPTTTFTELLGNASMEPSAFDYSATEGEPSLLTALSEFLAEQGGSTSQERLLITTGGMQGLDLACKILINPGDVVAVEAPTYTNAISTITSYQGEVVEVPCDDEGMRTDALADVAAGKARPKLIYTIPSFQNPSGTTLPLDRRRELLALAERWGAAVLEDDPYSMLRFSGDPLPSLQELAGDSVRVIAVHTFSKIIAPGLRVGWVNADAEIIELMVRARQGMDTCTNTLQQRLVASFIGEGRLADHLEQLRTEYARRKHAMQRALQREFAGTPTSWTDPEGGFFLWLTLPPTFDSEAAFPLALEEGVAYVPGNAFTLNGRFSNALRLAFSAEDTERLELGIARLRRTFDRQLTLDVEPGAPLACTPPAPSPRTP